MFEDDDEVGGDECDECGSAVYDNGVCPICEEVEDSA